MLRLTGSVVLPEPFDVANTTVSEYEPLLRLYALALRETVMLTLPYGAKVPLVAEKVSQLEVLLADQAIATAPVLPSV